MAEDAREGHIGTNGLGPNAQPTPFERFESFVKTFAAAPKSELNEKLAEGERRRKKGQAG